MEVLFNHSPRVRKTPMSFFFKRKLRHLFSGPCGHTGCGADMTADQAAARQALRRDWIVRRAASKLRLNAEQKPLLAHVLDQMAALRHALRATTPDPRAELRSWFAGRTFDAARAQALIHDKAQVLQTQSPQVVAALGAFYDSLNPDQQNRVRDRLEGRRGWFRRC